MWKASLMVKGCGKNTLSFSAWLTVLEVTSCTT